MTINYDLLLDWDGLAEAALAGRREELTDVLAGARSWPSPFRMSGGTGSIR
jgi:hypothetical protein